MLTCVWIVRLRKKANAAELPFPDGYFDCATVSLALHDKEKKVRDRVVSEMKRVVRPNGTLVFIDFQVPLPQNRWARLARGVEFLVGGDHYLGFKDYVNSGGLDEILAAHHLSENGKTLLKSGLVVVTRVTK